MEKDKREKLKKKLKRHEKLGALKFQKVVFGVEKVKYKALKKLWPNFIKHYEKYCDFKQKRAIKKATSEEEIRNIKKNIKFAKMAMRKEINQEKNRNYHMDRNKPTEIYKYLEWNKEIHKKGIIKDAVLLPIIIGGMVIGATALTPLLIFELISAGINFECINIQDYNMCRYKLMEERLIQKEERQTQKNIENYGEAGKVIYKTIEEKEQLPTMTEIIENTENKEQLEQLRQLIIKELSERQQERPKQKFKGEEKWV